ALHFHAPGTDLQAAGTAAGAGHAAIAAARGRHAALRPAGRGANDGDPQAIAVPSGDLHVEGLGLGGETLAARRYGHSLAGVGRRLPVLGLQALEALLDLVVGGVDVLGHLALEHTHAVEDLACLGEALLRPFAGLGQQTLQLGRVGAGGGLAL